MSKLLSMFGIKKKEEDNIPEVILNKDDPAPYYDKELKVWMIPGQEEEIKKMLAEQKKPPPIGKNKKQENPSNTGDSKTETVDNSLVNPRKQIPIAKKGGSKLPSNRYASILPSNSIDTTITNYKNEEAKEEETSPENIKTKDSEKKLLNTFNQGRSTEINNQDSKENKLENKIIQNQTELGKTNNEETVEHNNVSENRDTKVIDTNLQQNIVNLDSDNTLYVITF